MMIVNKLKDLCVKIFNGWKIKLDVIGFFIICLIKNLIII